MAIDTEKVQAQAAELSASLWDISNIGNCETSPQS